MISKAIGSNPNKSSTTQGLQGTVPSLIILSLFMNTVDETEDCGQSLLWFQMYKNICHIVLAKIFTFIQHAVILTAMQSLLPDQELA